MWKIVWCVAFATTLGGCLLPAANLQDARVVGEGNVRATGYWSGLNTTGSGGKRVGDEFGVLIGVGGSERSELQVRFERLESADGDGGYQFISLGPKFGLVEDQLAVLVPIGVYAGEDIEWAETFQIHPGLIGSIPVNRSLEFNAAGKLIIPFNPDLLIWLNIGFGLGLSSDFDRWAVLPEVGYSVCLDETGDVDSILSYGVALAIYAGR
jgi:hypothetical protein